MIAGNTFGAILRIFATGTREERVGINVLSPNTKSEFGDAYNALTRMIQLDDSSNRAHFSIVTLTQLLWSMVPRVLIEGANPDFRNLASVALRQKFGDLDFSEQHVNSLVVIFKRIRKYQRNGRNSPSLNLDQPEHRSILEWQHGKCSHCGYQFLDDLYLYAPEDDGQVAVLENFDREEITLDRTFRRPELDHIIPAILGGDSVENYQILCKSCNMGKSDHLSYLGTIMGPTYSRIGHLFDMTPGKRFGIIARERSNKSFEMARNDNKKFRIFRQKSEYHLNPENLFADYR